jgi:hypothetical protein
MLPLPSIIGSCACHSRHWPVVLGDAGPEHPYHYYCQQGEERLEESSINLAVCAVADVHADNILEDLSNSKEKGRTEEVDCAVQLVAAIAVEKT